MALDAHLVELSEKHRALDRKIEEEQARPMADPLRIAEWKRQKLRLKDEIERLKHEHSHSLACRSKAVCKAVGVRSPTPRGLSF